MGDDEDRLEAEEQRLLTEIDHIGAGASIAEMYARRMRSFLEEGQTERAEAALRLAIQWMNTYASWATSGGEGVALSRERDEFCRQLTDEWERAFESLE